MKNRTKAVVLALCIAVSVALGGSLLPVSAQNEAIKLCELGDNVVLHTDLQKRLIREDMQTGLGSYVTSNNGDSSPLKVKISWECSTGSGEYTLKVSEYEDMSSPCTYTTENTFYELKNLKVATRYYFTVSRGEIKSGIGTFMTEDETPRLLSVAGIYNVRDIGGYVTEDGQRVKQNLFIRGTCFYNPSDNRESARKFLVDEVGLKTEVDLRREDQKLEEESTLGSDIDYVNLPMYSNFNTDRGAIVRCFKMFAKGECFPVFVHCQGGKDRTGMVSYLLLAMLGCSEHDCRFDYMFSNCASVGGVKYDGVNDYLDKILEQKGDTFKEKTRNLLMSISTSDGEHLTRYELDRIEEIFLGTTHIYGDANNDTKVNAKDVLLLRKALAKVPSDYDFALSDVNFDERLNSKDVLLIRKHIAKIKVAPWDDVK